MRAFHVAVVLGIMAAAVPILKAHAGADVLVPSTTNGNDAPNLGLTPSDSTPTAPAQTPPAAPSPLLPPDAEYVAPIPPNLPPLPASPSSVSPEEMNAMQAKVTAFQAQMQAIPPEQMDAMKAKVAAFQAQVQAVTPDQTDALQAKIMQLQSQANMPTTVVKSPDMAELLKSQEGLPDSIDVSVDSTKLSGSNAKFVTTQLGIANPASSCHLSVGGYVQATKDSQTGMSVFDLGLENHGTAKYDGKISQVIAMVRALCDMTQPLPPNKGVVLQVGDKYAASLSAARCTPPASGTPHKILITIPTNGAPKCQIS